MHAQRKNLLWINLIGGTAVLGSYVLGIAGHESPGDVWGGVPESLKPLYTVNMFLAAAGYFLFTYFVFFRVDPERARVAGRFRFGLFNALYALILIPSALWMPLTFAMLDAPSAGLWVTIRLVLAAVGIGSLGLAAAVLAVDAPGSNWPRRLAFVGTLAFSFQTAVLDALVWPAYFPV